MPRAAGSGAFYTFRLFNKSTGKYDKDVTIDLPSSTTIVKATLAAPQLVGWAYRTTRDSIAGLLEYADPETLELIAGDGDVLEEWLADNKMRPDDVRDERAEEGTAAHKTLETLSELSMKDEEAALLAAQKIIDKPPKDLSQVAVADWFIKTTPTVIASEKVLPNLRYGYCGTCDLVYLREGNHVCVLDLKTRRAGLYPYTSDEFQVDSYMVAYNSNNPKTPATVGSVLIAYDDGTWREQDLRIAPGSFLTLLEVWGSIEEAKAKDPGFGRR